MRAQERKERDGNGGSTRRRTKKVVQIQVKGGGLDPGLGTTRGARGRFKSKDEIGIGSIGIGMARMEGRGHSVLDREVDDRLVVDGMNTGCYEADLFDHKTANAFEPCTVSDSSQCPATTHPNASSVGGNVVCGSNSNSNGRRSTREKAFRCPVRAFLHIFFLCHRRGVVVFVLSLKGKLWRLSFDRQKTDFRHGFFIGTIYDAVADSSHIDIHDNVYTVFRGVDLHICAPNSTYRSLRGIASGNF